MITINIIKKQCDKIITNKYSYYEYFLKIIMMTMTIIKKRVTRSLEINIVINYNDKNIIYSDTSSILFLTISIITSLNCW